MSDKFVNGIIAAAIALVISLGAAVGFKQSLPSGVLEDVGAPIAQAYGATSAALSSITFSHLTNLEVNQNLGAVQTFFLGAAPDAGGTPLQENVSVGTCNTASTTLFSVAPPSAATSTAQLEVMVVGGNATTSSLDVGTTTSPQGASSATAVVASTNGIATSTVQTVIGGATAATKLAGMIAATANTSVVVAANQYLSAYSTSTATGAGAANYSPTESTCTYKILWTN